MTRQVTTGADGSFSLSVPVSETTRVRAVAEGLGSQTLTVQLYSKVRIKLRRTASGAVVVTGTTSPKLTGRILWLRTDDVRAGARTTARNGRFTLRLKHPKARPLPGRLHPERRSRRAVHLEYWSHPMKYVLGAAAIAAATVLAVPAIAGAHPSVYQSSAKTYTGTFPTGTMNTVTRYVVTNHGFTALYTESNGVQGTGGVVGFNLVPGGTYRAAKSTADILAEGGTGVQAHATCTGGTAELGTLAKVAGWQGGMQPAPTTQQPFWNYVPFQTTAAGLGDAPADWLPTLLAAGFTTADFASAATAKAACEAKGGTYVAADTVQSTTVALALGMTEPLEEKIDELEGANTALTNANASLTDKNKVLTDENTSLKEKANTVVTPDTTLSSQVTSLTAELATANSKIAALVLDATPIKLAVGSSKAKTVAASGQIVGVTAAPLKTITVTISIAEAQARKLKLASSVLGRQTVTTAANGTASVNVKVSRAAAKALKALKGSLTTTVEATSGDRFATATSKLTR